MLPETLDVRDQHNGFTILTRNGNTLWRPADVAPRGTVGTLVPDSVNAADFYQNARPVVSGLYKLPGYGYRVKVWYHPDGRRIA